MPSLSTKAAIANHYSGIDADRYSGLAQKTSGYSRRVLYGIDDVLATRFESRNVGRLNEKESCGIVAEGYVVAHELGGGHR